MNLEFFNGKKLCGLIFAGLIWIIRCERIGLPKNRCKRVGVAKKSDARYLYCPNNRMQENMPAQKQIGGVGPASQLAGVFPL